MRVSLASGSTGERRAPPSWPTTTCPAYRITTEAPYLRWPRACDYPLRLLHHPEALRAPALPPIGVDRGGSPPACAQGVKS